MSWIEFTCGECGNKYTEQTGDTDERMCDECLNHEDEFGKEENIPIGAQPYPDWDDKKKEYIYKRKGVEN